MMQCKAVFELFHKINLLIYPGQLIKSYIIPHLVLKRDRPNICYYLIQMIFGKKVYINSWSKYSFTGEESL